MDPSLVSRQRQLKKARLTDELNEKIAHRPGPLELVEQHILEADDPIKNAIQGKSLLLVILGVISARGIWVGGVSLTW